MKILHITSKDFGIQLLGGIDHVIIEQVYYENLSQKIESRVATFSNQINPNFYKCYQDRIIDLTNNWEGEIIKFKPDFVVFHGFYQIHHYRISKFLESHKIKYFIKPHGGFSRKSQEKSKWKKIIARSFILNNYVRKSSGIIFLSDLEEKQSIYKHINKIYMPNGIESYKGEFEENKEKNTIEFVFFGRIDIKYKGLDILLDTLGDYDFQKELLSKKVKFVFYGTGKKKDMDYFLNRIIEMKSIVEYRGEVNIENKYNVLRQHDVFILLSRSEGMPLAVLEALELRKPCLITKETNFGELVEEYECGWVCNLDIENIRETILNILACYENNEVSFYANNCKKLSNQYNWESLYNNFVNSYHKLLFMGEK